MYRTVFGLLVVWLGTLFACERGPAEDPEETAEVSRPTEPESEQATIASRVDVDLPVEWLDASTLSDRELEAAFAAPPPSQEEIEMRLWYVMHPQTRREGHQRMQTRREREAVEDAEREAWLDQRPTIGSLTVRSRPTYAIVQVTDTPLYTRHPTRFDWLVETRSGSTFDGLSVEESHLVTVTLPNYQQQQIELLPFGEDGSQWERDEIGMYRARVLAELEPEPVYAEELTLRMNTNVELLGQITVRTEPPGAEVYYNGRRLVDDTGSPLTTPVTFDTYLGPETVYEVYLRRSGVPIRVELEGYLTVETGVYTQMYQCEPIPDSPAEAQWWEACRYTYDTGLIQLTVASE